MSEIIRDGVVYEVVGNDVIVRGLDKNYKIPFHRSIAIPSLINGNFVVMVAERAFAGSSLKRLVLPSSVSVIGNSAFKNSALELLEFDSSEAHLCDDTLCIGEQAFYNCDSLRGIKTRRNVAVAYQAFMGCSVLNTLRYPLKVLELQEDAFMNCYAVRALCLANNAKLRKNCFRESHIQTIYTSTAVKFDIGVLDDIYAAGIMICVPEMSKLWDLAYTGIKVEEIPSF